MLSNWFSRFTKSGPAIFKRLVVKVQHCLNFCVIIGWLLSYDNFPGEGEFSGDLVERQAMPIEWY